MTNTSPGTKPSPSPLAYHERTKHHYDRYARSAGTLDWASQPAAFRAFEGAPRVELPREPEPSPDRLDLHAVSDLLFHSLAVSAWKELGESRWALRVDPSSGNLHPTEGYLVLPAMEGRSEEAGVYHYLPRDHVLERRSVLAPGVVAELLGGLPPGSFLAGLSSIHWREAWKYGERAFRYCQHDTGHALCALEVAARLGGRRLLLLDHLGSATVARVLGLDREGDFPVAAEREEPELLAAVVPAAVGVGAPPAPSHELLRALGAADWTGRANRLSASHVDWGVIEEVARATRKEEMPPAAGDPSGRGPAPEEWLAGAGGRAIVRRRRSAVMFDGESTLSREAFARVLGRVLGPVAPLPWRPRIHLAFFVHLVDGLEPGIYLLPRDPEATGRLRAALRPEFLFTEALPGLPLRLLVPGDCRELAERLSCRQEIAGAGFLSLGMLADVEGSLAERGPWFYRRLFWEAGAVGQLLYLAAEVEGGRGTGIGCYFDDPVHDVLGLAGEFQSLYHFTMGVPVEDPRLTTLPAY